MTETLQQTKPSAPGARESLLGLTAAVATRKAAMAATMTTPAAAIAVEVMVLMEVMELAPS